MIKLRRLQCSSASYPKGSKACHSRSKDYRLKWTNWTTLEISLRYKYLLIRVRPGSTTIRCRCRANSSSSYSNIMRSFCNNMSTKYKRQKCSPKCWATKSRKQGNHRLEITISLPSHRWRNKYMKFARWFMINRSRHHVSCSKSSEKQNN